MLHIYTQLEHKKVLAQYETVFFLFSIHATKFYEKSHVVICTAFALSRAGFWLLSLASLSHPLALLLFLFGNILSRTFSNTLNEYCTDDDVTISFLTLFSSPYGCPIQLASIHNRSHEFFNSWRRLDKNEKMCHFRGFASVLAIVRTETNFCYLQFSNSLGINGQFRVSYKRKLYAWLWGWEVQQEMVDGLETVTCETADRA